MAFVYLSIVSLDGYVADADGDFSWAAPDEEVHRFVNDLARPVSTYLYGHGMYDVMTAWETAGDLEDDEPVIREFAEIWRAAEKVVYSTTLKAPRSARTRVERTFDPEVVARLVTGASGNVSVGGPHLAASALRAGLVDEIHVFVVPFVAGAGTSFLPDDLRLGLRLVDERRFASGVVYLHYLLLREPEPEPEPGVSVAG